MLARVYLATCLAVVVIGSTACNQGGHDAAQAGNEVTPPLPQTERARAPHAFADPASGIRFVLPSPDVHASVEHFDPNLPAEKIRHSVTLSALGSRLVRVDVWDNPEQLPLQTWFDRYLAFTVVDGAVAEHRLVGKARVDGIVVNQPRSPQSEARRITTFATGGRIVRVTCLDSADTRSVETFDQVLGGFELEVAK